MGANTPAEQQSTGHRQLHLGCGRNVLPGWINLDIHPLPGVDVVADLDDCAKTPLPFDDNSIDKFLGIHVLEHIRDYLSLMQELHRIAKPGAEAVFLVPYGSSDDAFEDPTHVRPFFINSFAYFAQPFYWRADYGYRGDWQPEYITLRVKRATYEGKTKEQVFHDVRHLRNVVEEMMVLMRAVKPIRPPKMELQALPKLNYELV